MKHAINWKHYCLKWLSKGDVIHLGSPRFAYAVTNVIITGSGKYFVFATHPVLGRKTFEFDSYRRQVYYNVGSFKTLHH